MGIEDEYKISKRNRRRVENEAIRFKEITHPFITSVHIPTSKDIQKRAHDLERKAIKKKS